ncbi:MAG: hypothetical protein OXD50_13225 [Chloroflexi bacterium]|nr:hypothetical protein [Chloroflexota bacterium]
MKWILLRCNHQNGGGVSLREFEESQQTEAFEALNEAERDKPEAEEVVLFLTESEEMLRRTHSRYFYSAPEIAEMLRENLDHTMAEIRQS